MRGDTRPSAATGGYGALATGGLVDLSVGFGVVGACFLAYGVASVLPPIPFHPSAAKIIGDAIRHHGPVETATNSM